MPTHDARAEPLDRWDAGAVHAKLAWGLCSDKGPHRDHNEDFTAAFVETGPDDAWRHAPLFAVADGMGGHAAGEVASRTAVEALGAHWKASTPTLPQVLRASARAANTAVVDASLTPGQRGMGTTLTALALSGHETFVAHVGDSRAYVVRERDCRQLTTDHSRVAEMVRMKLITAEQAASHPARSQLTRSLGGEPFVQVDIVRHDLRKDDVLLLCSDGVWDRLSRPEIVAEVQRLHGGELRTPKDLAAAVVDAAIKRGSTDNVTAVVVHVTSDRPIPPSAVRRSLFRRGRT